MKGATLFLFVSCVDVGDGLSLVVSFYKWKYEIHHIRNMNHHFMLISSLVRLIPFEWRLIQYSFTNEKTLQGISNVAAERPGIQDSWGVRISLQHFRNSEFVCNISGIQKLFATFQEFRICSQHFRNSGILKMKTKWISNVTAVYSCCPPANPAFEKDILAKRGSRKKAQM